MEAPLQHRGLGLQARGASLRSLAVWIPVKDTLCPPVTGSGRHVQRMPMAEDGTPTAGARAPVWAEGADLSLHKQGLS